MSDKRLSLFGLGITAVVSAGSVWAQGPANETPQSSSVSERLAWSIQAYVPCDWTSSLATIEVEIATASVSNQEVRQALGMVLANEEVCDPVKDASARLLTRLPESLPVAEDATITDDLLIIAEAEGITEQDTLDDLVPDIAVATAAEEVDQLAASAELEVAAGPAEDILIAEAGGGLAAEPVAEPETIVPEEVLDVTFKMRPPPGNSAFTGN